MHIERFLLNLLSEVERTVPSEGLKDLPDWLRKACEEIRNPDHFSEGTQGFSRLAGRSPEHVARVLKQCTGHRPSDLVNEARLDYAARKLAISTDSILDISLTCGFSSLSHFYRLFRNRWGTSPRKYRMHQQATIRSLGPVKK